MTTREMLLTEIAQVPDGELSDLYQLIRQFRDARRDDGERLLDRLSKIAIDAPADFASDREAYASGQKSVSDFR